MIWEATVFYEGYFRMCARAVFVIAAVFALRLLLRRLPKHMLCLLWMAVFFRLLCPVTVPGPIPDLWGWNPAQRETAAGGGFMTGDRADGKNGIDIALPQEETEQGTEAGAAGMAGASGMPGGKDADGKDEDGRDADGNGYDAGTDGVGLRDNTGRDLVAAVSAAWQAACGQFAGLRGPQRAAFACGTAALLGTVLFMLLGIRRYAALARLTKTAVKAESGIELPGIPAADSGKQSRMRRVRILECAGLSSPMVFGVLCPAVYLPAGFAESVEPQERELILLHEEAHIRRGDHLFKILAWAVLGLHWWNPLVWVCVALFQKDMEMACDEFVMAHTASDARTAYAGALLHFSMQRSGLMFPAAFGESNTEQRVRNILKYRKKPVAVTALALCAVAALTVCLVTNPHAVGEEPGADAVKAEEKTVFASVEEMRAYYLARWQEKLEKEVWHVGTEEPDADGPGQIKMTFCTLEPHTGIPTVYVTRADCARQDGGLVVEKAEEESFERVETAEQARRVGSFPFWGYFGQDRETGSNCAGVITENGLFSSALWQFDLEEPEKAVALLLHLEGGSAAFRMNPRDGQESGFVTYTFADGSAVTYQMSRSTARRRGRQMKIYWFPEGILDDAIAREQTERAAQTQRRIEAVTAQALREAEPFEQYAGDFYQFQDGFVWLDQAKDRDIALYGLLGGDAMVLRDGERCYPVYLGWTSPQMQLPRIYAGDYDGDGQEEYALWTHMGTGTGVSTSELYMIEKTQEGISIWEFDRDALEKQFERVGYDWEPEEQTLYMKMDGERTGLSVSLKELLEEEDEEPLHFQSLEFHEISDFVEKDGQWYYRTQSGTAVQEWAILDYACGVEAEAPVLWRDGSFSLGEITLKEYRQLRNS